MVPTENLLELAHEREIGVTVLLLRPFIVLLIIGILREGSELLRMVEDVCYDDLTVLPGGPGILQDLPDVVLVHGDSVAAWHPLVEVALGHRPALGVHAGCELHPTLRELRTALLGGRDELVLLSRRNPS